MRPFVEAGYRCFLVAKYPHWEIWFAQSAAPLLPAAWAINACIDRLRLTSTSAAVKKARNQLTNQLD